MSLIEAAFVSTRQLAEQKTDDSIGGLKNTKIKLKIHVAAQDKLDFGLKMFFSKHTHKKNKDKRQALRFRRSGNNHRVRSNKTSAPCLSACVGADNHYSTSCLCFSFFLFFFSLFHSTCTSKRKQCDSGGGAAAIITPNESKNKHNIGRCL